MGKHNIVVLGAGYGGLRVTQRLSSRLGRSPNYQIILIDKNEYHTFMTQLHELALEVSDSHELMVPLREVLDESTVTVIKGEVNKIDMGSREIVLNSGQLRIPFKYLVFALGGEPEYFGIEGLRENSTSLNSLNNAKKLNCIVRGTLEDISSTQYQEGRPLTFVVGGGGLTGVELAGELDCFLSRNVQQYGLREEHYKIVLVESASELLPGMSKKISSYARQSLEQSGVEVITGDRLVKVIPQEIYLASGRKISFRNFVWAGGVRGNKLISEAGLLTDKRGRLMVNQYLQYVHDQHIFAVGDSVLAKDPETEVPVLPTAQAALQQGELVASNIFAQITGGQKERYVPGPILLLINVGRKRGLGETKKIFKITGRPAVWLKKLIPLRYIFLLGGPRLFFRRMLHKTHSST